MHPGKPWSKAGLLLEAAPFVLVLLDAVVGPDICFLHLAAVLPALAAINGSVATVLRIGAISAALSVITCGLSGDWSTADSRAALGAVVLVTFCSAWAARRRLRTAHRLSAVETVAEAAQGVILQPPPPRVGRVNAAASYVSAARAADIGGDFYAVEPVRGGVRVIVGDVQGKGLEAVRTAATVLASFREAASTTRDLEDVGRRVECALTRRREGEEFATAVLSELRDDGTLLTVNYGHPDPLVIRRGGAAECLSPPARALPLGLGAVLGASAAPVLGRSRLGSRDRILFYTDGLSEARDADGAFYPVAESAGLLARDRLDRSLGLLRESLHRHAHGDLEDDSALLLLEADPAPAAEPRRGHRDGAPRHPERHPDRGETAPGRPSPLPVLAVGGPDCEVCPALDCPSRSA
ncbi:serine/threonine-protein phosphatase [Streptomyces sp. YPW6]|uniref:PP2C family protein-serine/threonine phosphatase n=1 Tax=Streptomyces sp. YPW6 TaxID=2840373 RepID=UPI001C0B0246|nr:PP2C family protein-serine/threonine phosphatase [Streptomyces sp. YPW6]QWQ43929.1 serine/threonine-protein phosphatase [Streptomyces sp. YPW6]